MQLLTPKDNAVSILRERLAELNNNPFNSTVWKSRTVIDLKRIFGGGSDPWLQISKITFDTVISSEQVAVRRKGISTASGLLLSYIDFIEKYSAIDEQKAVQREQKFEAEYYQLLKEYNKRGEEFIQLQNDHSLLMDKYSNTLDEVNAAYEELNRLNDETINLDNITLLKLWKAVIHLPTTQMASLITIIAAVIGFVFWVGHQIADNNANNQSFELKFENKELKREKTLIDNKVDSLTHTLQLQADSIMRLRMPASPNSKTP